MQDEDIRIRVSGNKTITLKDLFKGKEEARRQIARMPFEKKIEMLVSMQETARSWGRIKDVIVWKI